MKIFFIAISIWLMTIFNPTMADVTSSTVDVSQTNQNVWATRADVKALNNNYEQLADDITQTNQNLQAAQANIKALNDNYEQLAGNITQTNQNLQAAQADIKTLNEQLAGYTAQTNQDLQAAQADTKTLHDKHEKDLNQLTDTIEQTQQNVLAVENKLSHLSVYIAYAIIALLFALIAILLSFLKKFRTQKEETETAQLDDRLIELLGREITSSTATEDEIDHSLALKIANEIVKLETNLSRMDKTIKGYKQLFACIQRIKDNFKANGYEIVDMLGKTYHPGIKAAVSFVTNENLQADQKIISRVIKPQVNYKQRMIQAAQIEVSQAE